MQKVSEYIFLRAPQPSSAGPSGGTILEAISENNSESQAFEDTRMCVCGSLLMKFISTDMS